MSSISKGLQYKAAFPPTSGNELLSELKTGTPEFKASNMVFQILQNTINTQSLNMQPYTEQHLHQLTNL